MRAHEDVQSGLKKLNEMIATATDTTEKARSLVVEINRVEKSYGPVATDIVNLALTNRRDEAIVKMDDQCRPLLAALIRATDAYADYTQRGRNSDQRVRGALREAAQSADRDQPDRGGARDRRLRADHARGDPTAALCDRRRAHGVARRSAHAY